MKTNLFSKIGFCGLLLLLFSGCDDKCENIYIYQIYEPIYMPLSEFRAAVKTLPAQPLQKAGKIYIKDKYLYINEINKGIHVFDNSNPAAPQNVAFINIPGNVDMAVKDNILYADSFIDLVALDISNPAQPKEIKRVEKAFNEQYRHQINTGFLTTGIIDSTKGVIVDWKMIEKRESSECNPPLQNVRTGGGVWMIDVFADSFAANKSQASPSGSVGIGGSTARFTILNNVLYAVDWVNLNVFDIKIGSEPKFEGKVQLGWGIETIFPYKDKLFIGSQTGMFIYQVNSDVPAKFTFLSGFAHARACDPVVADDDYAYVTLRSTQVMCNTSNNELVVVDIKDINKPVALVRYPMQSPHGLGIDGKNLFIGEGDNGLKRFDKSNLMGIDQNLSEHLKTVNAIDVIPYGNLLIVTGKEGIYQFDYSDPKKLRQLSRIAVNL